MFSMNLVTESLRADHQVDAGRQRDRVAEGADHVLPVVDVVGGDAVDVEGDIRVHRAEVERIETEIKNIADGAVNRWRLDDDRGAPDTLELVGIAAGHARHDVNAGRDRGFAETEGRR